MTLFEIALKNLLQHPLRSTVLALAIGAGTALMVGMVGVGEGMNRELIEAVTTPRGTNNTVDVTIVAIAKNVGLMSQFSSFIDARTLLELYQFNDDTTGALQLYLPSADMALVKSVQERLRLALGKAGYELME